VHQAARVANQFGDNRTATRSGEALTKTAQNSVTAFLMVRLYFCNDIIESTSADNLCSGFIKPPLIQWSTGFVQA
jgi:hypothetical protein